MMTIWADNATATLGGVTYTGKAQIRDFFATKAAPFQPQNHWVFETPGVQAPGRPWTGTGDAVLRVRLRGRSLQGGRRRGERDQKVARVNGTWLITDLQSSSPALEP